MSHNERSITTHVPPASDVFTSVCMTLGVYRDHKGVSLPLARLSPSHTHTHNHAICMVSSRDCMQRARGTHGMLMRFFGWFL